MLKSSTFFFYEKEIDKKKKKGNSTYPELTWLLQNTSQSSKSLTLVYQTFISFQIPLPLDIKVKSNCRMTKRPLYS